MPDASISPDLRPRDGREPRRDFLFLSTAATAAFAAGAMLWPLIASMSPASDTLALRSIKVDLSPIQLGQRVTVKWRGQPVFIDHRAPQQVGRAKADDDALLKDPEPDSARVKRQQWLIVVGVCTHLGCVPLGQLSGDRRGKWGGWFCPCHGSHYDTSGRIRQGPAPRNLVVPQYRFLSDNLIQIG